MNIVLGIYKSPHFELNSKLPQHCSFPFREVIGDYFFKSDFYDDIILDTVIYAASACNTVIFLIDDILPNLNTDFSITCRELIGILSSPLVPNSKIEFREDNVIVSLDYVCTKLNINKELYIK